MKINNKNNIYYYLRILYISESCVLKLLNGTLVHNSSFGSNCQATQENFFTYIYCKHRLKRLDNKRRASQAFKETVLWFSLHTGFSQ